MKNLKTVWKLFGLTEETLLTDARLTSSGIETGEEMIVFRKHIKDFDTELNAIKFIDETKEGFEHGFEIVKTFQII